MFVYINDNFLHAPSTDLSKELVKYLVGITTAQAQEVFLEKVEAEGRGKGKNGSHQNPALVARLAATAGAMYAGLGEEVKEFFGKGIIDRGWVNLIAVCAPRQGCDASVADSPLVPPKPSPVP
jgi:tyrosine-protein phosphatase non-receptor type 23